MTCVARVVHERSEDKAACGLSSKKKPASTKMTKMPRRKRMTWVMDSGALIYILMTLTLYQSVQRWTIAGTDSWIVNENLKPTWTRRNRPRP
jgi:hypothetical protein